MRPRDETTPRHRRSERHGVRLRRGVLLAAALGAAALTGAALLATAGPRPDLSSAARGQVDLVDGHSRSSTRAAALPAKGPVVRAAAVLRTWDEQRARAWAEGDLAALRRLYVDRAGVADVRLLRRYAERGYRVEGLTTQLLAVDVLDRVPDRWRLRVTDRVVRGVAVRGGERLPLPRDRANTHVVTFARGDDGQWRVLKVRRAPRS